MRSIHLPKRWLLMLLLLGAVGCSHNRVKNGDAADNTDDLPPATPGVVHEVQSFKVSDPEPANITNEELESIPVEINSKVEQWISYFQRRGRPHMERYLARSGRYSKLMKRILKQNGLPEDLIYIALIESGFSSKATSRAAAVGYWQFIRGTGKRYGLEINSFVDERRDPVLATQAAADYFKGLYSVFGSWYLAMASYNVGENRVYREVMNHKTRNFWELVQKRRLPRETMNYVPKYIAAKLIAKDPAKYGFTNIEYEAPVEFELIKVSAAVNLKMMSEKMNIGYDELKQINPKFRGEVAPVKANGILELRVPIGKSQDGLIAARASIVEKLEFVADAGETETYRIKPGDSLSTIARKHKTTVAWLRDVNDLRKGRLLRVGMRIQVPDRDSKKPVARNVAKKEVPKAEAASTDASTKENNAEIVTSQGVLYVVQPGDSLYTIAEEYDSTVSELLKMNKMRKGQVLRIGMKLKVPKDSGLPSEPGEEGTANKAQQNPEDTQREPNSQHGTSLMPNTNSPLKAQMHQIYKQHQARMAAKAQARARKTEVQKEQRLRGKARTSAKPSAGKRVAAPPPARVHVVKKGESLTRIATKYRVPLDAIVQRNRLAKNADHVTVGRKLQIPD